MSDGQYVLSIPLHTSYTIVHKVLLQLLFVLENIGYYIITEKNTDRGFEIYSLMSATIQFSQKHFIFEMMYSLKLCNQNLTIYCCIFFCKYHGKLTERLKTCIAKAGLILDGLLRFFSFNCRSLTVIRRKRSPLIVRYKHIMSNKRAIMFVNYRNFPQKVQIIRRNSVA